MSECSDSGSTGTMASTARGPIGFAIGAGIVLFGLKLVLAIALDPFGDEAFYWWESRHLAAGYTDVPPLGPWLIRLSTILAGNGTLGLRFVDLLIGSALPFLTYAWARRLLDRRGALEAAALSLCVPLGALLGVLALPDVPLTAAMLGAVIMLDRAQRDDRWRDWLGFGACLALGWLSHYRFVMFYLGGAAYVLGTPQGRALLARPKFWVAHAVGALGLVPILWFNFLSGFAALKFQFVERHPWAFHADALTEPLVQLGVTTPLLFALLVLGMWRALRGRGGTAGALLAAMGLGLLLGYLVLDCFADATRVRFHWPLPAYLVALPALPPLLADLRARGGWRRALAFATPALGALGVLGALLCLAGAISPANGPFARYAPDHLIGWREIGAFGERERAAIGTDAIAIAGDFLLGAEWAFQRHPADAPYVLDHWLNVKHGRAGQLAIWRRNEAALRDATWSRGLVLVDESAQHEVDVLRAYRSLCTRFGRVEYRDELALRWGRLRVLSFAVEPGAHAEHDARCHLPPLGYIDAPAPHAKLRAETVGVSGWAIAEYVGVASVELLVDGQPNGAATYGTPAPQVRGQWPDSEDPNHPRVGFMGTLDLTALAPGRHHLALRIVDKAGAHRESEAQTFTIERPSP